MCWSSTKQISLSSHRKVTCSSNNDLPWGNFIFLRKTFCNKILLLLKKCFFCKKFTLSYQYSLDQRQPSFSLWSISRDCVLFRLSFHCTANTTKYKTFTNVYIYGIPVFILYYLCFSSTVCPSRASQWNIRGGI